MKLLIASNNMHKHQELREIFAALDAPVELIAPRDLGIDIDPAEVANTYAGNALLKAKAFAQALRNSQAQNAETREVFVIADDSGLEVDALNGAPGIFSSRYHKQAPGGDGCAALLGELQRRAANAPRTARFRCVMVLIVPDGRLQILPGSCAGAIAHEKRGLGGFGFDPIFIPADASADGRTMAELPPHEKHLISHRGIAARKAVDYLTHLA